MKFNLIEKSLQDVEGKLQNELQSLKDDLMSVDISDNTPTTSDKVSSNNISITLDSPDKVTSDQHVKMPMQTKFESPQPVTERYHFQRRQAKPVDFVFLMDSNRRFLEIESAFPERKVRTIPTGSIEKAQFIIDNPRFSDIKALCIHTGVNDLESDTHDSNSIAKSLIEVAKSASRRFPNTKVFISEITPRRDEYNLKGIEVNSILKEEAQKGQFELIKHGNLAKETLFYDKVHLSKFKGITIMKNNIINSFKNIFPNLEVSYTIQPAFGKPFRPREPLPAATHFGPLQQRSYNFNSPVIDGRQIRNFQQPTGMAANIQNNSYARAVSNRGEGIVNNKDILMSEMIKQISQMNVHLNTLVNSNY